MVTSSFDYFAPTTLDEATSLLSRYRGEAKVLAGGHSLIPMMKLRLAEPGILVDIGQIDGLSYIREDGDGVSIGSMTTYREMATSSVIQSRYPLLADASSKVADLQVRNRGTIGGSLAHSDPAGDIPAVVLAIGGSVVARTRRSSREIAIDRFQVDLLTTALHDNEIITEIKLPSLAAGTGTAYSKFHNPASHYAITGVAAVVTISGGVCTEARVAVTGAGDKATRARRTERILRGKELTPAVIRRAAERAAAEVEDTLNEDIHATAEYRVHMTQVHAVKAIEAAVAAAG
ncbi:MAG: xanthine dehydrogenase family protein subunit M [Chloroflexi bacterium]|nr:xanthine dehydrogenase family protein subunit M [Chloroflexota bacterium]